MTRKAINPLWAKKSRARKTILNAAGKAGLTVYGLTWDVAQSKSDSNPSLTGRRNPQLTKDWEDLRCG